MSSETDIDIDSFASLQTISSPSLFFSSSNTECSVSNLIETLTYKSSFIKLEPNSPNSTFEDLSANVCQISSAQLAPAPYDYSGDLFANKLPIYAQSQSPVPLSMSESSSSLSLSLDVNSSYFFSQGNNVNSSSIPVNHTGQHFQQFDNSYFYANQNSFYDSHQPYQSQQYNYQQNQDQFQFQHQTQYASNEAPTQHSFNISASNNNCSSISLTVNQNNYSQSSSISKQDVSVGTDLTISKDMKCKSKFELILLV